jgi:hypothetical protein
MSKNGASLMYSQYIYLWVCSAMIVETRNTDELKALEISMKFFILMFGSINQEIKGFSFCLLYTENNSILLNLYTNVIRAITSHTHNVAA